MHVSNPSAYFFLESIELVRCLDGLLLFLNRSGQQFRAERPNPNYKIFLWF